MVEPIGRERDEMCCMAMETPASASDSKIAEVTQVEAAPCGRGGVPVAVM